MKDNKDLRTKSNTENKKNIIFIVINTIKIIIDIISNETRNEIIISQFKKKFSIDENSGKYRYLIAFNFLVASKLYFNIS